MLFMIDSHAHLQDEKFNDIEKIINNAKNANVTKIICASSSISTSKKAVEIANRFKNVYATIGIHPEEAQEWNGDTLKTLEDLALNEKVVALGETGLDYYYEFCSREKQKESFISQIKLSNKLKLPLVIHTRNASGDTMDIIRKYRSYLNNGVVIHCYSMSLEILSEILNYGFYISLGGAITFKNARNLLDIARAVDLDKLMLETDCPYMAPEPFRGEVNEPKNIEYVAKKIAELKNISFEEVASKTTNNAIKFFRLKDK